EPLLVVSRDAGALRLRTQLVLGVMAERADLHPALLHLLVELLHQVLAALLGQCRDVEADERAVVVGGEPKVAADDRLLDGLEEALVPGLDDDELRFGRADRRERDERRRWTVRLALAGL